MKLKDMTAEALVKSAQRETLALGERLDGIIAAHGIPADDALVLRAYIGSLGARLIVAESKLDEAADMARALATEVGA